LGFDWDKLCVRCGWEQKASLIVNAKRFWSFLYSSIGKELSSILRKVMMQPIDSEQPQTFIHDKRRKKIFILAACMVFPSAARSMAWQRSDSGQALMDDSGRLSGQTT
jgi:hypothetical protein